MNGSVHLLFEDLVNGTKSRHLGHSFEDLAGDGHVEMALSRSRGTGMTGVLIGNILYHEFGRLKLGGELLPHGFFYCQNLILQSLS